MSGDPRAFVIGHPIGHSRSPVIHGHWLKTYGIAGTYDAHDVAPDNLSGFFDRLRSRVGGFVGGNVTMPHKEAVLGLVDHVEPAAARFGAGNTVWLEDGLLCLTNTDGYGFLANLDAAAPGWDRIERAVILGAGGASRAVIDAVLERGIAHVDIVNRTRSRAEVLAAIFARRCSAHDLSTLQDRVAGAGLFINTSSLGLDGSDIPEVDFGQMADAALVTDIVYAPLVTPILSRAVAQGMKTVDGLGMLLHQAVPGFEKWFGRRPEVTDELRALVVRDLEASH